MHSLQPTYHFTLTSRSLSSFSEPPLRYYVRSSKRSRTNAQQHASQGPGFPLALLGQTRRGLTSPAFQQSSIPAVPVRPWLTEMPGSNSTLCAPSYGSPILHLQSPPRLVHYALAFLLISSVRFQPLSLLRSSSNRPNATRSLASGSSDSTAVQPSGLY